VQVLDLKCPGCGAPSDSQRANCDYCGRPIVITSFRDLSDIIGSDLSKYSVVYTDFAKNNPESVQIQLALAICKIKLNQFESAKRVLTKLLEKVATNPDVYFYLAVSLLDGKSAFVTSLSNAKEILSLLNSANSISPSGLNALFQAYVAFDYFERKFLNVSPNFMELLQKSRELGLSSADAQSLKSALQIQGFGFPEGDFDKVLDSPES
jgi:tetratricopeptide (TPR) repeat protein